MYSLRERERERESLNVKVYQHLRPEEDQSIWSKRRQGFQPCCEAGIGEPTLSVSTKVNFNYSRLQLQANAHVIVNGRYHHIQLAMALR